MQEFNNENGLGRDVEMGHEHITSCTYVGLVTITQNAKVASAAFSLFCILFRIIR